MLITDYRKAQKLNRKLDKADTNHLLHLFLTVFTAGAWAFIWLSVSVANAIFRYRINRALDKIYKRGKYVKG